MPASSQQSPTSGMRRTGRAQWGQRMRMPSSHGRCSSGTASTAPGSVGQLPELAARADHGEAPALARVEGQGQAPVPLARDAPVAHVGEPVVHPQLHVAREPRDALVGGPGQRSDLGGAQEPLVRDAEDQLLAAPPAGGIAMAVRGPREEQAALLQEAGDRRGGVGDRRPREGAQAVEVAPLGIHRRDDGEPVPAAEVEVLEAAARARCERSRCLPRRTPPPTGSRGAPRPAGRAARRTAPSYRSPTSSAPLTVRRGGPSAG